MYAPPWGRKRHVVTANKGPAAFAFRELDSLAGKNNVHFLFESAVMDGAPVFNLQRQALRGCRVTGISGILNTTTNFVISRLEMGETMAGAVKTAQELGFAEADPALDLEGWDAAAKTAILANVFLDAGITPLQVERRGIGDLTSTAVKKAAASGRRWKLICRAEFEMVTCGPKWGWKRSQRPFFRRGQRQRRRPAPGNRHDGAIMDHPGKSRTE